MFDPCFAMQYLVPLRMSSAVLASCFLKLLFFFKNSVFCEIGFKTLDQD